jgi:2',3'-cyclic-nucleotide 2'-phosphodiesterase (5'-nucleotidase family)
VITEGGTPTLVVQAGENGEYVGCLNVSFNSSGVVQYLEGSRLLHITAAIEEDEETATKLATYQEPINDFLQTVIGETLVDLNGNQDDIRSGETNLGNLVADAMLDKARQSDATIALYNGGSIRASVPAGEITMEQVISVLPYDRYLVVVELTGEELTTALENGVSLAEEPTRRFPVVSGLRFTWDTGGEPGNRVRSVETATDDGYEPLVDTDTYRIVTNNYVARGGDGYNVFRDAAEKVILGATDYEVLVDYINEHSPVNPQVEGRIVQVTADVNPPGD